MGWGGVRNMGKLFGGITKIKMAEEIAHQYGTYKTRELYSGTGHTFESINSQMCSINHSKKQSMTVQQVQARNSIQYDLKCSCSAEKVG